jgi:shikimate kinase
MVDNLERIFLIGFMGSGKTTIGRLLAQRLEWQFVDLDEELVRREGMPIEQIFAVHGEPYFRRSEALLLETLLPHKQTVIALGGGTPAQEPVWNTLQHGLVIYLRCHPEELFRRLKDDNNRPMLGRVAPGDRLLLIKNLLQQREPFYLRAELIVDSFAQHPPDETAAIISQLLQERA